MHRMSESQIMVKKVENIWAVESYQWYKFLRFSNIS